MINNETTKVIKLDRSADTLDLIDLKYNSRIILYNLDENAGCLSYSSETKNMNAFSKHAIVFTIINCRSPRDKSEIKYNDYICFKTDDDKFLHCNKDNEVYLDRLIKGNESLIKWQIIHKNHQYNPNQILFDVVKQFDEICFINIQQKYLICDINDPLRTIRVTTFNNNINNNGFIWSIVYENTPYMPDWSRKREILANLFSKDDLISSINDQDEIKKLFQALPMEAQEQMIIKDLLLCLIGIDGTYISKKCDKKGITLFDTFNYYINDIIINSTFIAQISKILPLCKQYSITQHFINIHSRYEYGMVSHALASAMRHLLKQFTMIITQLEQLCLQGNLTLLRLYFYLTSSIIIMQKLEIISLKCIHLKGGTLLSELYNLYNTEGDENTRKLLKELLSTASIPYFKFIEDWIYNGILNDPYHEFYISIKRRLKSTDNDYLSEKYIHDKNIIPNFLKLYSEKIFNAGKYLNIMDKKFLKKNTMIINKMRTLKFSENHQDYSNIIETCYNNASHILLENIIKDHHLLIHLSLLRKYFLLAQGDFILSFLDLSRNELSKPLNKVNKQNIRSILEKLQHEQPNDDYNHIIQYYNYDNDDIPLFIPFLYNKSVLDCSKSLKEGEEHAFYIGRPINNDNNSKNNLIGIKALCLKYNAPFPVNVVLSNTNLSKYNLIFRHLFYVKHIEQTVSKIWKATSTTFLKGNFVQSFILRHRLLFFIQNYLYHCTIEVLEPNWHQFNMDIKSANTIDEVIYLHNTFLDNCLKECLLTQNKLLSSIYIILDIAIDFSSNIESFAIAIQKEAKLNKIKNQTKLTKELISNLSLTSTTYKNQSYNSKLNFENIMNKYLKKFEKEIQIFIKNLQDNNLSYFGRHLYARINYNGFYD